ncbi:hypothetical protein [uncultured Arthrobacter sp.]|uniref:hypothetical protein n=1 Tax=uncultured Arthrobacter sp. TaxID=114050 RepID=UPI0028D22BD6|nr:hypothetical protein [uncultured Arthrobacter sp.]
MTPSIDLLLQGPRGRRLCLELAMELDQEVRNAAFWLAYELDSGRGTSRVLLSAFSSEDMQAKPPTPSLEWLAARLKSLDFSDLQESQVQGALERSVDSARYWQPPDGEDVLAGLPEVAEALSSVAEQFIAAPRMQWCWQHRQVEQWAIDWRHADDPAPLPKNPGKTLTEWARKERAEEVTAARERPSDPTANVSGTWWSIPHGLMQTVGQLPAGLSLVEDSLGWEHATTVPVRGSGKVLEINTAEDWINLCRKFPLEVTASRRHDWFHTTERHGRWVIPQWEKVAGEWDATHLTVMGYLSAAGRPLEVDLETATVIAGWDPDSTIWLTDVAREWIGPRQQWHRDSNRDEWIRTQ